MKRCVSILLFAVLLILSAGSREVGAVCALIHPHTVTSDWHPSPPDRINTRIENTYYWDDHFEQNEYYGFGTGHSHPCGAAGNCDALWSNESFSDISAKTARWSINVQDRSGNIPYPIHCQLFCSNDGTQREEIFYYTCQ